MIEELEKDPIDMLNWITEWQQNPDIKADLIPLCFYDFLKDTGTIEINNDIVWDYWEKAIVAVKGELHKDISSCKTNDASIAYAEFEKMDKEKRYTKIMTERLRSKAKKLILFDFFRKK